MAWVRVLLSVLAIFLSPSVRGDLVTASLDDTVKLLSSKVYCEEGSAQLVRRLRDLSSVPVADSVHGVLQPVEGYRSRLSVSSSGVFLKNVNFNDNGHYEFFCGVHIDRIVELKVLFMSSISAAEGETTKLPCFSVTLGMDVKYVQWETNGELVIKVDRLGKVEYGGRFTDRVSLSPGWRSVGDLSLILKRIQLEDQGDYHCYVQTDSKQRGDPAAWSLRVQQERPSIKTSTTPSQHTQRPPAHEEPLCISIPVFIGTIFILVVSAPLCILVGWSLWSHKSNCLRLKCCWDREGCSPCQEASTGL